jgi:hypothetical protein
VGFAGFLTVRVMGKFICRSYFFASGCCFAFAEEYGFDRMKLAMGLLFDAGED